jgi:hypothetical protein
MKNLFLYLSFTLVSFYSFANVEKESVVVPFNIESKVFTSYTTENVDNVVIKYEFDAATFYAAIYYKGEYVTTVYSYATGTSSFDAQLNCLQDVNRKAQSFISMSESFSSI